MHSFHFVRLRHVCAQQKASNERALNGKNSLEKSFCCPGFSQFIINLSFYHSFEHWTCRRRHSSQVVARPTRRFILVKLRKKHIHFAVARGRVAYGGAHGVPLFSTRAAKSNYYQHTTELKLRAGSVYFTKHQNELFQPFSAGGRRLCIH